MFTKKIHVTFEDDHTIDMYTMLCIVHKLNMFRQSIKHNDDLIWPEAIVLKKSP